MKEKFSHKNKREEAERWLIVAVYAETGLYALLNPIKKVPLREVLCYFAKCHV